MIDHALCTRSQRAWLRNRGALPDEPPPGVIQRTHSDGGTGPDHPGPRPRLHGGWPRGSPSVIRATGDVEKATQVGRSSEATRIVWEENPTVVQASVRVGDAAAAKRGTGSDVG